MTSQPIPNTGPDQPAEPPALRALLALLTVAAITGGIIFSLGQSTTLACERLETALVECTLSRSILGRFTWQEQTLRGVRSAELQITTTTSEGTTTDHYNVLLRADNETTTLLPDSTTGPANQSQIANRLTTYLNNPDTATFHENYRDSGRFALATLLFGGLVFLLILVIASFINRRLHAFRRSAYPETAVNPARPELPKPVGPVNTYLGAAILLAAGLLMAYLALNRYQSSPVSGTCTVNRVGVNSFLIIHSSQRQIALETADNQVILANRDELHRSLGAAERQLLQYQPDQPYSCFYDPWFPLPGLPGQAEQLTYSFWLSAAAALFFVGSGLLTLIWIRFRANMPPPTVERPFIWPQSQSFKATIALPGLILLALVGLLLLLALMAYPSLEGITFLLSAVPLAFIIYYLQKTIRIMATRSVVA